MTGVVSDNLAHPHASSLGNAETIFKGVLTSLYGKNPRHRDVVIMKANDPSHPMHAFLTTKFLATVPLPEAVSLLDDKWRLASYRETYRNTYGEEPKIHLDQVFKANPPRNPTALKTEIVYMWSASTQEPSGRRLLFPLLYAQNWKKEDKLRGMSKAHMQAVLAA